jgi:hypothetical protein
MQFNGPLTLTLFPSNGERETARVVSKRALSGECAKGQPVFSLSPSDGERVGVRGISNHIVTAKP